MPLKGKRILLGVTGGIAAYKAAHLTRLLIKAGAEVKVIMTASALDFITPLTLSTLSKNPVYHQFFNKEIGEWNSHVELGLWADLFLIAPLTANTLAKLSHGQSDDLLSCAYLSARCPVMLAPAMDLDMYLHPAVKANLLALKSYGNLVLDAEEGELASGLTGQGRMMEPEHILEHIIAQFSSKQPLKGKKIMITAGPTQEAIDPVRYISNHSSGKMGMALAEKAALQGAQVYLILGPTHLKASHPNINTIPVVSADEMYEAAKSHHNKMDAAIFAAAVADYTPSLPAKKKLKKTGEELHIPLKQNPDIAHRLGTQKRKGQVHVGFALETDNEPKFAVEKLKKKNFDFIVLNSLKDEGAGFQKDTNQVTLFFNDRPPIKTKVLPKNEIAEIILEELVGFLGTTDMP